MDLCDEWNFKNLSFCTYVASSCALSSIVILIHIFYFIRIRFNDTPRFHSGYLPFLFILCCMLNVILIFIPILFVVYDRVPFDLRLIVFIIFHTSFWLVLLFNRSISRNFHQTPIVLVSSEAFALLISIIPLFYFRQWFRERNNTGFSSRKIAFYSCELCIIIIIYLCNVFKLTQRVLSPPNTAWSRLSQKLVTMSPYVWPQQNIFLQARVIVCILLLILGRIINVSLPLYSKWIVDGVGNPDSSVYHLIIISCFLKFLQGSGAMGGFLNTLRSFLWIPIQQYTTYRIKVELFEHLHELSLRWHLARKTGQILRIMDRGTSSIDSILNYILFNILPTIVDILIAIAFFFFVFDPLFGLLVLLTMVIYLALTIFITEWRTKFRRDMNDQDNFTNSVGVDSLLNYETVKYYNAEEIETKRFSDSIKRYQKAEWATIASLSLLNFCQNATIGIGLVGGSLLVAYFISMKRSNLSVGDYVLFTTYMLQLYSPLNFFGTIYRVIQQAFIDMENMFDLLSEEVEITDKADAITFEPTIGTIELRNVVFGYTPEKIILHNVSFKVQSGETIAIVGTSGGGKSTIIRLLLRLFDVYEGNILFDGQDIRNLSVKSLRKHIGIVPQDTPLFNESIRYNIRYGDPTASDSEVEIAARAAEIHDRILSFPQAYETIVGERGLKLSGGEKQRVAIARTVLKNPRFLLLDEATSSLDTPTERAIQKCLAEISKKRTTIVVAHRLSTIINSDMIIVLENGTVVESGKHSDLLERKARYFAMWEAQNNETVD